MEEIDMLIYEMNGWDSFATSVKRFRTVVTSLMMTNDRMKKVKYAS